MKYMIELYGINDRAYLESFPVGRIADEALRHIIEVDVANGEIKKADILKFKTEKGQGKSTLIFLSHCWRIQTAPTLMTN